MIRFVVYSLVATLMAASIWSINPPECSFKTELDICVKVSDGIEVDIDELDYAILYYIDRMSAARGIEPEKLQEVVSQVNITIIKYPYEALWDEDLLLAGHYVHNKIVIAWLGGYRYNALFHEITHHVRQWWTGGEKDRKHEDRSWWDLVTYLKEFYSYED